MINNINLLHKIFIITLTVCLFGCNDQKHSKDLSSIKIEPELVRFEDALFKCSSTSDVLKLSETSYFYDVYVNTIIPHVTQSSRNGSEDVAIELYKYSTDKDIDSLYKLASRKYGTFSKQHKELVEASKYINYYFPEDSISAINTFVATFEYGSIYNEIDQSFGVGLDMYMGRDFEVYGLLNPQHFPFYRVKRFEPYNITPNCIKSYLNTKVFENGKNSFLDYAIYEGKKLYGMDLLLPKLHDSLKMGYSSGQIEWNRINEKNIWSFLIEKEVLFSTEKPTYMTNFFNDGPFTTPFGNESSPKTGAWVGWQIVRAYMDKYPEVSYKDLLADKDHLKIFKASGYKP